MKHTILLLLTFFLFKVSMCQEWHSASKKLKITDTDDWSNTMGYFDHYDTARCVYVLKGDSVEHRGFKLILDHNDDYKDNARTFRVFYDDKMNRVYNVDKYYLK